MAIRGKGDRTRVVPLNLPARRRIEDWLAVRSRLADKNEPALFVNRSGKRLSTRSIWSILNSVGEAAGIDGLTPHALRHTALTILVRNQIDLVLTAEIAGHRRVETTRRYTLFLLGGTVRRRWTRSTSSTRCHGSTAFARSHLPECPKYRVIEGTIAESMRRMPQWPS